MHTGPYVKHHPSFTHLPAASDVRWIGKKRNTRLLKNQKVSSGGARHLSQTLTTASRLLTLKGALNCKLTSLSTVFHALKFNSGKRCAPPPRPHLRATSLRGVKVIPTRVLRPIETFALHLIPEISDLSRAMFNFSQFYFLSGFFFFQRNLRMLPPFAHFSISFTL